MLCEWAPVEWKPDNPTRLSGSLGSSLGLGASYVETMLWQAMAVAGMLMLANYATKSLEKK